MAVPTRGRDVSGMGVEWAGGADRPEPRTKPRVKVPRVAGEPVPVLSGIKLLAWIVWQANRRAGIEARNAGVRGVPVPVQNVPAGIKGTGGTINA